jgi:leader peptidase (prepilin peptidase)/N-methyltransferase
MIGRGAARSESGKGCGVKASRVKDVSVLAPFWVWPVIAAPFVGSFLGVVVMRARMPQSILVGRSACDGCGERLGPADLVPLASWLAARGRCRHCGQSIGAFYPAIELAALGVALWSAWLAGDWLLWPSCVLGWLLLTLAAIDLRCFLLPDFLTLPLLAAGLLLWAVADPAALASHAIGAGLGFAFVVALRQAYWLLRRREGIGLGDAKLLAAAGAWVSWEGLASVLLVGSVAALASTLLRYKRSSSISLVERVPFGAFLCLGIWLVWLYGPLAL